VTQALGGPEIEVVAKATRRRYTLEYKRKIVREADGCKTPGAVGALLRREGLSVDGGVAPSRGGGGAGMVREQLRRWASEWGGRLDRGSLMEHLDEATRVLAAARTDLAGPETADVGVTDSPARVLSAATRARQSPGHPALGA
jgi:hypothetical protein